MSIFSSFHTKINQFFNQENTHLKNKKYSLKNLTQAIAFDVMKYLDFKSANALSLTNRLFADCYRSSQFCAHQIHTYPTRYRFAELLPEKKVSLYSQAGRFLTKLGLFVSGLTDEHFRQIVLACPNIEELELSYNPLLTNKLFHYLPKHLKSLELSNWNNEIDKRSFADIPENLKRLTLTTCKSQNVIVFIKSFKKIEALNLIHCSLTNKVHFPESLHSFELTQQTGYSKFNFNHLNSLPDQLRHLHLNSSEITKETLSQLFRRMQKLRSLSLRYIDLTGIVFETISPHLECLRINQCKGIDHPSLLAFLKRVKLKNIHLDFKLQLPLSQKYLRFIKKTTKGKENEST